MLEILGQQLGRSGAVIDLAPVLLREPLHRNHMAVQSPFKPSRGNKATELQYAVLHCLKALTESAAVRAAHDRCDVCTQLIGGFIASDGDSGFEDSQLSVLFNYAMDINKCEDDSQDEMEDHALVWLKQRLVPLVMNGVEPVWEPALHLWRAVARYTEHCATRASGSVTMDVMSEVLIHTQRKLVSMSSFDQPCLETGMHILSIWSNVVSSSCSEGSKQSFLGLFVERDGFRGWVEQYARHVLGVEKDGATGIAAMRKAAVKHYLVAVNAFKDVHSASWGSQHAALLRRVFGFLSTPLTGLLYTWLERTPWNADSSTCGLMLELLSALFENKKCTEVLAHDAEAAIELHYISFLKAYCSGEVAEAEAHLRVLLSLAHAKTPELAEKFYQLRCMEVLVSRYSHVCD